MGVLFLQSEPRPFGSDNPEGREKVGRVALWVRSVASQGRTSAKSLESWMGSSRSARRPRQPGERAPGKSPWVGEGGSPAGTGASDLRFHSERNGKPLVFEVEESYDLWY